MWSLAPTIFVSMGALVVYTASSHETGLLAGRAGMYSGMSASLHLSARDPGLSATRVNLAFLRSMVCVLNGLSLAESQDDAAHFVFMGVSWVGSLLFFPNFSKFGWRLWCTVRLLYIFRSFCWIDSLYPERRHNSPTGLLSVAYRSTQSSGLF